MCLSLSALMSSPKCNNPIKFFSALQTRTEMESLTTRYSVCVYSICLGTVELYVRMYILGYFFVLLEYIHVKKMSAIPCEKLWLSLSICALPEHLK